MFGINIKKRRQQLGLSQTDLARIIGGGVKQQNIQQVENGIVSQPRYLGQLLQALGCTYNQAVSGGFNDRVIPGSTDDEQQLDAALALEAVSIRLPSRTIKQLKIISDYHEISSISLVRDTLSRFAEQEMLAILRQQSAPVANSALLPDDESPAARQLMSTHNQAVES